MFSGPASGGLVAGPTAGNIVTNPAQYIPENGLLIAHKHPLITTAATLPQNLVTSLTSDLAACATTQQLTDAMATRQPLLNASRDLVVDTLSSRLYLGDVFRFGPQTKPHHC